MTETLEQKTVLDKGRILEVLETPRKMRYTTGNQINLKEYLDTDSTYHTWSRACDAGH